MAAAAEGDELHLGAQLHLFSGDVKEDSPCEFPKNGRTRMLMIGVQKDSHIYIYIYIYYNLHVKIFTYNIY